MYFHVSFFFNDTATTEIDTYEHTLSRHDALPIYQIRTRLAGRTITNRRTGESYGAVTLSIGVAQHRHGEALEQFVQRADRSDEHTSELQSLMRISYAVFCLKNKK